MKSDCHDPHEMNSNGPIPPFLQRGGLNRRLPVTQARPRIPVSSQTLSSIRPYSRWSFKPRLEVYLIYVMLLIQHLHIITSLHIILSVDGSRNANWANIEDSRTRSVIRNFDEAIKWKEPTPITHANCLPVGIILRIGPTSIPLADLRDSGLPPKLKQVEIHPAEKTGFPPGPSRSTLGACSRLT